jgi:hypothetical protein
VYRSLEAHRKIRNEFAHDPFTPGFGDPKVASLVKNMEPYERHFLHLFEEKRLDPSALNTRFLFRVRAMMTCHQMITELMVAPLAIRFGIEPFRFLDQTSDGRSRALQELTEAAGVVLADLTESEVTMTGSGADG